MSSEEKKEKKTQEELNKLFEKVHLSQFPLPKGKILEIKSDTSVKDAALFLIANNVLSMPVVDVAHSEDNDWLLRYVGLVDMIDIANFVLAQLEEKSLHAKGFAGYAEESKLLNETPVSKIVDKSDRNPFVPLEVSSTLRDAMLLLGKYHLYRVPVVDGQKQSLVNFLTQSSIVKMLQVNIKKLGGIVDETLQELGLAKPKKMISVTLDSPAITAFQHITHNRIGAVPVVGVSGEVVGNISARDLRAMFQSAELYGALFKPLSQYLSLVHGAEVDSLAPAITCRPSHTLRHVINMLTTSKIHRVYIVDDKGKLITVLSLTDIISALVTEPEPKLNLAKE